MTRSLIAAALLLGAAAFAAPRARAQDPGTEAAHGKKLVPAKRAKITFPGGKSINAYVVDTPIDRERGLMYYKKLSPDFGELFVFPREMMMTFWMKNTLVPLDIVFIGADKKITVVHARMKATTPETPDEEIGRCGGTAQYVLELPAGAAARRKLKAGDRLKFSADIPLD
jgi:uncharacterized membrane protein (UPF0127 family)